LLNIKMKHETSCNQNPLTVLFAVPMMVLLVHLLIPSASLAQSTGEQWQFRIDGDPQVLTIKKAGVAEPLRRYAVTDTLGRAARITCLIDAPTRRSVFAVLAEAGEIWEMAIDADAQPVYPGFVHNFREGQVEGIAPEPQPFARRRLRLEIDHSKLIFSPDFLDVIAADGAGGYVAFNLDARRQSYQYKILPFQKAGATCPDL
jgi:dihydro-heme d1 dehydrogenase